MPKQVLLGDPTLVAGRDSGAQGNYRDA